MNNENRKDELAEHCEFLSRKQIHNLPNTLICQIARAKNMINFGQQRLNQMRDQCPFHLALDDDAMKLIYNQIRRGEYLPRTAWEVEYVKLLLEFHWLGSLLLETARTQADILVFAAKRHATARALEAIELQHSIRAAATPSERWQPDDAHFLNHEDDAKVFWINDLKEQLRGAVAAELHWLNTLHKHGHSKSLSDSLISVY